MIGEFFVIKRKFIRQMRNIFNNSNDRILDVGCGEKPYYHDFMKGSIICLDIRKTGKVHVVGDADFLPLKKGSFDKAIMVNSLYYYKNSANVIDNISSILKKNGKLLIIAPFFYPIHDSPDDKYRFTEYGVRTILEKNFKIEKIEPVGGLFNLPVVMLHALIKGLPLVAPKQLRSIAQLIIYIIAYPLYIIAQLLSVLDALDKTGRFPTYYIAIAARR